MVPKYAQHFRGSVDPAAPVPNTSYVGRIQQL